MAYKDEEARDKGEDRYPPVTEFTRIPSQESARTGVGNTLAEILYRQDPDFFRDFTMGIIKAVFQRTSGGEQGAMPSAPPAQVAALSPPPVGMPPGGPPPGGPPMGGVPRPPMGPGPMGGMPGRMPMGGPVGGMGGGGMMAGPPGPPRPGMG